MNAQGLCLVVVEHGHASFQTFRHVWIGPAARQRRLLPHEIVESPGVLQVLVKILFVDLEGLTLMFEKQGQPLLDALQQPLPVDRGDRTGRDPHRTALR